MAGRRAGRLARPRLRAPIAANRGAARALRPPFGPRQFALRRARQHAGIGRARLGASGGGRRGGAGAGEPRSDGTYEYTGEGQVGDQSMTRGNRRIRDHASLGERLRLFRGARGVVTYIGEFRYVTHRTEKARASRGHSKREVFVFQLRPVGP